MNAGEKTQKKLIELRFDNYRPVEILLGSLIFIAFALISFFLALSIKKAVKKSFKSTATAVTSVKIGTITLPIDVETSGNSATSQLRLSDFVSDGLFDVSTGDDSIVSSLAYTGSPKDLQAPILSLPSGYYAGSDFPINLQLNNPNDLSTWLMVSLNGQAFAKLEGQSLTIGPENTVEAYVRGDTQRWNESKIVRGRYRSKSYEKTTPKHIPVERVRYQH